MPSDRKAIPGFGVWTSSRYTVNISEDAQVKQMDTDVSNLQTNDNVSLIL